MPPKDVEPDPSWSAGVPRLITFDIFQVTGPRQSNNCVSNQIRAGAEVLVCQWS